MARPLNRALKRLYPAGRGTYSLVLAKINKTRRMFVVLIAVFNVNFLPSYVMSASAAGLAG